MELKTESELRPDPEWLYYDSQIPIPHYTVNTGELEVERLLQSYDTICKTQTIAKQKCTLVVEDFTANQWSDEKKSQVKQKLLSLISKGHDVYVYQDPQMFKSGESPLIKLSTNNINLIDSPAFEIPLVKKKIINDLMQSLNIPASQIAHVDTAHLKELLGDPVPGLTIKELDGSQYPLEILIKYLSTEMPNIVLFNSYYSNYENEKYLEVLNKLKQSFPIKDSLVDLNYYPFKPKVGNINALIQASKSTLKNVLIHGAGRPSLAYWDDVSDVHQLAFITGLEDFTVKGTNISSKMLISILENNHQLQKLWLSPTPSSEKGQMPIPAFELKQLSELMLTTRVKKSLSKSILEASPNLKKLVLFGDLDVATSEKTFLIDEISKCSFHNLEIFKLHGSLIIDGKTLFTILNDTFHLKELDLCFEMDRLEMDRLEDGSLYQLQPQDIPQRALSKLRKLQFSTSILNQKTLAVIFEKTIKLEELFIYESVIESIKADTIPDKILANLKVFCYCASNIFYSRDPNILSTVLKKMIRLEYLTCSGFNALILEPECFPIEILQNLKQCDIEYGGESLRLCQHILQHATKLDTYSKDKITEAIEEKRRERLQRAKLEEKMKYESSTTRTTSGTSTFAKVPMVGGPMPAPQTPTTIDADTSDDAKKEYNIRQIFKGLQCPDPSNHFYRLEVFDTVTIIDNRPKNPFELTNPPPEATLVDCPYPVSHFDPSVEIKQEAEFNYYKGNTPVYIGQAWVPLPSLSTRDILTHVGITTSEGKILNRDAFDLKYSNRDNLYYLKSKSPQNDVQAKLEFLIKKPVAPAIAEMPESIKSLVKKYLGIDKKDEGHRYAKLKLPSNPRGQDVLKALQTQQVGACRHRAIAFKKEVEDLLPEFPVRIITNVSHAFVEIYAKSGTWVRYDLGGYPSDTLLFDETGKPISESTKIDMESTAEAALAAEMQAQVPVQAATQISPQETVTLHVEQKTIQEPIILPEIISEQALEGNPFKTWESDTKMVQKELMPYLLDIAQGTLPITTASPNIDSPIAGDPLKKILIKLDSKEGTEACGLLIQKQMQSIGKQVFYIHSPEDLICSAPWIERDLKTNRGKIRASTYPPGEKLRRFLNANHPNPALVVNWSNFKAADIVKFNSVL
jgi:hypothetical protein